MKILVCSLTYPLPNGVTSSINESVNGLVEAGHDVKIVSPDYGVKQTRPEYFPVDASELGQLMVSLSVKLWSDYSLKERLFGINATQEIRQIVDEFEPDVFWLHTVSWARNAFERLMLKSDRPKLLTYHTMIDVYGQMYAGDVGERRMIKRSIEVCNAMDAVITPSHFMKQRLLEFGVTSPVEVIPTGIEPSETYYTKAELAARFHFPASNFLLMYVGRVVKEKNIEALLAMMVGLKKILPNVTLVLVGPGEITETKARAAELGIADALVFTGQLPLKEAQQCYGAADLFVFASQSETQGLVIGEAMLANVPVAALSSPIQPEVYPKEVALVVDQPEDFADEVAKLLQDKDRREQLAAKGKKFVTEHFSKKTMIDSQTQLLERLVAAKKTLIA